MYGIAGVWLMNRTTVASARAYGALLLVIAKYPLPEATGPPPAAASDTDSAAPPVA